ncbi:MAG: AI-2E family transporter, partial [Acetivibrio ethanolgignens]
MNLDKDTIKKLRGLILFTVFLLAAMLNLSFIGTGIRTLFKLIFPFLLGGCIAFILNVPMSALENKLFHQIKSKGLRRGLSLVSALLLVIGIIFIVMFLVIPELGTTFLSLSKSVPVFVERLLLKAEQLFHENPQIVEKLQTIEFNWEAIFNGFLGFFKNGAGNFLGSTVNVAMNIVSSVTTFFIALVFSFYILLQKE